MREKLNPLALSAEDTVRLLKKAGWREMTMEILQSDVAAGMELNNDGTVNLVYYMAWLIREVNRDVSNELG